MSADPRPVNPVVVLDASAALRAVLDSAAQTALIDRIAAADLVLAPTLLRAEVGNALWKYRRSGLLDLAQAVERHAEAMTLVHRLVDDADLFPEALALAVDFDHPAYDTLYLVTARRHAAAILSFDHRLHAAAERARIAAERFGG